MKNKSIYNIIFYTILVFCISAFSYFPESYSKYIKDEIGDKSPVRYHVNLESLRDADIKNLAFDSSSTYEIANYIFDFNRSDMWKSGDSKQVITIEVEQTKCKIININGVEVNTENTATIEYDHKGTDKISVIYSCNVSDIKVVEDNEERIFTNVYIYEQFNSENRYLYKEAKGIKVSLDDYYENFPIPNQDIVIEGNKITIPDGISKEDAKNGFDRWIDEYYIDASDEYKSAVNAYIKTVYNTKEDMLDENKELKGMTYSFVDNNHIYEIDANFLGYARTYYGTLISDTLINIMFSNPSLTDDEYNEITEYYFKEYGKYDDRELEKIMHYIKNYGSIKHVMTKDENGNYKEINGITYDPIEDKITLSQPFMDYVNIFYNQKIEVKFAKATPMYIVVRNSLKTIYGNLISDELYNLILGPTLNDSISKNAIDVTDKPYAYTDYFTYKDPVKNNYILLIISSDGVTSTTVQMIDLGEVDTLVTTQTVTEDENSLSISITNDNQNLDDCKTRITDVIKELDKYFNTTYKDELTDNMFIQDTETENIKSSIVDTNVTIEYIIKFQ